MTKLTPFALKDAPALIESVFPAQKVSFEAQKERKANLGQTLTGLGSYWKGRKPLILVRAIVLGSLLPQTGSPDEDLEIFEKLMAFDDEGLARRALVQNALNPAEIAARIELDNPWDFFQASAKGSDLTGADIASMSFPLDASELGLKLSWLRGLSDDEKLPVFRKLMASFATYEEKASIAKRPEELDEAWMLQPVWAGIKSAYGCLGITAETIPELLEQLGVLRFGHRPRVGDTFSGGGSIPFEAARIGCDTYASDLNPVACMLTWGALNIVGSSEQRRREIEENQKLVAHSIDKEITQLGIEHDGEGNRAKSYLYALETRCPETGWLVPLAPSWLISKQRNIVAVLTPNHDTKTFDIEVVMNASKEQVRSASVGTVNSGALEYELHGKTFRTPIKTIRGDFRDSAGSVGNRLRQWEKHDFASKSDDVFRERLFAIQWITKESVGEVRHETFFRAPTKDDIDRENRVNEIVRDNLASWQDQGLVPDMPIEPGQKTDEPIRTRGWTHWHHLFNARQLLLHALYFKHRSPEDYIFNSKALDWNSRIANWMIHWEKTNNVFYNQALNTFYNYGTRCFVSHEAGRSFGFASSPLPETNRIVRAHEASAVVSDCDLWITDPPYADAVNYHEITEFFIAWLRKNPPAPFNEWVWDSRRALAIKGSGDDFRKGMVDAYKAMANHMPDNGMQCVMFTHQDTGVWSDMIGIFWAAGLQVVAAWYIATETTSELKKGGYVQGTVILMLRKRPAGDKPGFKQRIIPAVRTEVARQIESMLNLNEEVKGKMGEHVFNDSDLQMAGYAAALKVLTAYTQIGGEDVTNFALRPKAKGEVTVVDEIVQQAAEAANSLLVPEGLSADTWARLTGIQRFYLRMMDMETTGASKLDNYQNFAKAFRVEDYTKVMSSVSANAAKLKGVTIFETRDLTDSTEIGSTWLGRLIIGLRQILEEVEPQTVVEQIQVDLPDFLEVRAILIDMMEFFERKAPEKAVRDAAEVLGSRLKNIRAIGN